MWGSCGSVCGVPRPRQGSQGVKPIKVRVAEAEVEVEVEAEAEAEVEAGLKVFFALKLYLV